MINEKLLTKIEVQNLTLGLLSYLQDKHLYGEQFPREYYKLVKTCVPKIYQCLGRYEIRKIHKMSETFYFGFLLFGIENYRNNYFCFRRFCDKIWGFMPKGMIEQIQEDILSTINTPIKPVQDVKNMAIAIYKEDKYSEIPYLADACEEYDFATFANHFRTGIHTCMCPYLRYLVNT